MMKMVDGQLQVSMHGRRALKHSEEARPIAEEKVRNSLIEFFPMHIYKKGGVRGQIPPGGDASSVKSRSRGRALGLCGWASSADIPKASRRRFPVGFSLGLGIRNLSPLVNEGPSPILTRFSRWASTLDPRKKLYTVIVYYGGNFVHVPIFSYTSNTRKIYQNIDLEELSVQELKDAVIKMSKKFDYIVTLYVYHQTPTEWDDDIDNFIEDCAYSDKEFNEIRRATQDDRLKMNEFEKEYNINNDSGSESYTSYCSADYDGISSEDESDREVCYATPSQFKKGKSIEEIFSAKTDAKDIKWKVGLVFASKKEFKDVVRFSSMETGRPYQFLVDDLKRMQVGCAKGCPFKMWVTYFDLTQS
ncbi:hypothetical protein AgCh_011191 [Apium graveolens]